MDNYERLGQLVKQARKRKYRFVEKARAAGGLSRGAWDNVEHGKKAKEPTYSGVEIALGWPMGECQRILDGGEPTTGPTPSDLAGQIEAWPLSEEKKRRLIELVMDDEEHDGQSARYHA